MSEFKWKKKDILFIAALMLFFIGIAIWDLWSGINGLFFSTTRPMEDVFVRPVTGTLYEGQIVYVSHKPRAIQRNINLRWAGTEYYHVIFSETRDRAILVRAPKHWGEHSGSELYNQVSLSSKGIVKSLRYKTRQKLSNTFSNLAENGIQIQTDVYLDVLAISICWTKVVLGVSLILGVICCCLLLRRVGSINAKPVSKGFGVFMGILLLVIVVCMLYLRNKA